MALNLAKKSKKLKGNFLLYYEFAFRLGWPGLNSFELCFRQVSTAIANQRSIKKLLVCPYSGEPSNQFFQHQGSDRTLLDCCSPVELILLRVLL